MCTLWLPIGLILLKIVQIRAQSGGVNAAGQLYSCVPAGFCNNGGGGAGGTNPNGIDPRIVTPGQLCPAGTIVCYTQGTTSQCGNRFIPQTNTADGNADQGAYPWQAYLQNSTNPFAGSGVLLDNYHVLTAAHKVALSVSNPSSVNVIMGVYNPTQLTTNTQARTVSRITLHPNFNPTTLMNDIAILTVSSPFSLSQNNINTACLPVAGTSYVGQRCVVSGWGQTAFNINNAPTNPMKQAYVTVVPYATCRASFANASLLGTNVDIYLDPSGEICAGGNPMEDACTQDGGSPLICPGTGTGTIAGLVIWGKGCGQAGVYGVYVNVPYYRGWIDTTLQSLNNS